jgi:hypothetical protein
VPKILDRNAARSARRVCLINSLVIVRVCVRGSMHASGSADWVCYAMCVRVGVCAVTSVVACGG